MKNKFDLQAQLEGIYARYPEASPMPVIGITGNYEDLTCKLGRGYYQSVVEAGGVPVIIPPVADRHVIINTLQRIDGLILSGGGDYNPLWAGEEPSPLLHGINQERDNAELLITRLAYNRQISILGICRGIQTLAMTLGGKVAQDISEERGKRKGERDIKHSQDADRSEPTHSVTIESDSMLFEIYDKSPSTFHIPHSTLFVNSFHHQAVSDPGTKFRVVATAPDGVIEAMESSEYKPILGVQWHPECMESGLPLFQWLVREANLYREAHQVHDRILTLDTHCDTPMFFPQGIHFEQRDPRILVDLHKMTEGRQDATIMVSYLPQPTENAKAYADNIFDQIETIVHDNRRYLALARTPEDLWKNKHLGLKSIMLGIENGIALEHDIVNIQHFADRGIVYITLCHNGDNDICDSASKSTQTHGGVSQFGAEVIAEMNRLGILVDMSHAGEKSFYDALDISTKPIVCSHSSARALCDHPRNLTDDQMRALAAKGGVAQTTIYNGFLCKDAQATILDVMAHLEHAIDVMGIDHVGLGTDFDGDGGVPGLADSSELLNFTRQLLRKRYSDEDIQKIWGGNFLRVMAEAQKA